MFREMIRKNNALSLQACIDLLKEQTRGVLSVLGDDGYPYGMPMNHWYNEEDGKLYFHCGNVGHRLDALEKCDKVCFCTYDQGWREEGHWAWNVQSVIVFGRVKRITDMDTIVDIATKLSHKFTQDDAYIQQEIKAHGHRTVLLQLTPEHISGKRVKEA